MSEFQSYIGIKHIRAKPATFGEARDILKRPATEKDLANWQRPVQLALLHARTALLKGANDIIALSTVPFGTVGHLL